MYRVKDRKSAAFWSLAMGGLVAANFYLFFEDGMLAASRSSEDVPSPDESEGPSPGPEPETDDEDLRG